MMAKADVVLVSFAKGRQVVVMEKEEMGRESSYFRKAFDGPFIEATTRCIRLIGDSPFAVQAMTMFMVRGFYYLHDSFLTKNPRLTILDLHVHAYIIADKYQCPGLSQYAVDEYLRIAARILSSDVSTSDLQLDRPLEAPRHPMDMSLAADMDQLFDSIVMLWEKPSCGYNAMRTSILNALVLVLPKVMRFKMFGVMIKYLDDFAYDLEKTLEEQGLSVQFTRVSMTGMQKTVFGTLDEGWNIGGKMV
jgi:hypothetical protein